MKADFLVSGFQGVRERPEISEIEHVSCLYPLTYALIPLTSEPLEDQNAYVAFFIHFSPPVSRTTGVGSAS